MEQYAFICGTIWQGTRLHEGDGEAAARLVKVCLNRTGRSLKVILMLILEQPSLDRAPNRITSCESLVVNHLY